MIIHEPIGSKERFFEMFQGVTKVNLNEVATGAMQTGTELVAKAFEELKNKVANIKQTNTQTVDNENFIEIITNDQEGNEITFSFKIASTEADQDGVFNVDNAVLSKFKIKSPTLNVEMPENMQAVQDFNAAHGDEIMSVVGEYADFETNTMSVEDDEMYEEAVKLIDKVPYKKSSEEIQTHKHYADQKPTNPEVRVDNDELQMFVKEMEDFVASTEEEDDIFALPPDYTKTDLSTSVVDDGTTGVDPYNQIDTDYDGVEANPEEEKLFIQAYDNLIAAGNKSPTAIDIENEFNKLQGNVKPVEKTRAIPKGAEAFYEVEDTSKSKGDGKFWWKIKPQEVNESTDQDRYEDVMFAQGEDANEPLDILNNQGEEAALKYLQQWHSPGTHMGSDKLGHGSGDQTYEKDGYIMAWNFPLNYIGLQYDLSGLDETEEKTYPDQIGKKFKTKRQFPKKKRKPQTVVKLSEKSKIPKEYWGNSEDSEVTDELLGYKPHNVIDYASEEFDYAAAEKDYHDKEDMRQHPEDDEEHPLAGIMNTNGTEKDLSKQNIGARGINRALDGRKEEIIDEENGFDEYSGEIGDRYQDGEGNQFTVRDKLNGSVTLQGQGGEKEIATRDIQFLKKLSEEKIEKKEVINEEQIKIARQVLKNRRLNEGMTKKEAVQLLIKHNIK